MYLSSSSSFMDFSRTAPTCKRSDRSHSDKMCPTELCFAFVIAGVVAIVTPVAPTFLDNDDSDLYLEKYIKLLQQRCPKRVINHQIFNDVPACLVENLADSPQMKNISKAIKAENWGVFFKNVCRMFPIGKRCLRPVADLIDDCTSEGYKFNAVIDSVEDFFCASFSPDTLNCIVAQEQELKTCTRSHFEMIQTQLENTEVGNQEKAFCETFNMLKKCDDHILMTCNDTILEVQVTSFTRTLSETMKCPEGTSGADTGKYKMCRTELSLVLAAVLFIASPVAPNLMGHDDDLFAPVRNFIDLLQERCPKIVMNQSIINETMACLVTTKTISAHGQKISPKSVRIYSLGLYALLVLVDIMELCFLPLIPESLSPGVPKCRVEQVNTCLISSLKGIGNNPKHPRVINENNTCEYFQKMRRCDEELPKCDDSSQNSVTLVWRSLFQVMDCSYSSGAEHMTLSYFLLLNSMLVVGGETFF
ncbi:unnamed protein product [Allacma fusca]|uniref:Uncharacterized protein n=1 Tax=Allacma fusca TaxID=39272 RepID=A0A8J2NUS9_9HEXA|nr:unnamed protein product [Allacma fusca]